MSQYIYGLRKGINCGIADTRKQFLCSSVIIVITEFGGEGCLANFSCKISLLFFKHAGFNIHFV